MRPKDFSRHLTTSLIPHKYRQVIEKKMLQGLHLYFRVFVFVLVVLFLIMLPVMHNASQEVVAQTEQLENATLSLDFHTNSPLVVLQRPEIVIDSDATDRDGAFLRIGEDALYRKKLLLFGEKSKIYDGMVNAQEDPQGFAKTIRWVAYLILPGLVLFIGLLMLAFSQFIALISALITRLIRKNNTFRDYYMVSLHAQLMPLLIFLWSLPFINFWWLGLLIYVIIYVLAVILLSSYKFKTLPS